MLEISRSRAPVGVKSSRERAKIGKEQYIVTVDVESKESLSLNPPILLRFSFLSLIHLTTRFRKKEGL